MLLRRALGAQTLIPKATFLPLFPRFWPGPNVAPRRPGCEQAAATGSATSTAAKPAKAATVSCLLAAAANATTFQASCSLRPPASSHELWRHYATQRCCQPASPQRHRPCWQRHRPCRQRHRPCWQRHHARRQRNRALRQRHVVIGQQHLAQQPASEPTSGTGRPIAGFGRDLHASLLWAGGLVQLRNLCRAAEPPGFCRRCTGQQRCSKLIRSLGRILPTFGRRLHARGGGPCPATPTGPRCWQSRPYRRSVQRSGGQQRLRRDRAARCGSRELCAPVYIAAARARAAAADRGAGCGCQPSHHSYAAAACRGAAAAAAAASSDGSGLIIKSMHPAAAVSTSGALASTRRCKLHRAAASGPWHGACASIRGVFLWKRSHSHRWRG